MASGIEMRRQLLAAERSADEGLIAQAEFAAAMLRARLALGLGACVERDLVAEAGATLAGCFAHRERVLNLHDRMADVASRMGIEPRSFGDEGAKANLDRLHPALTVVQPVAA